MFEFGAYSVSNMCQRTLRVSVAVVNMMSRRRRFAEDGDLERATLFHVGGGHCRVSRSSLGWRVGATVAAGAAGRRAAVGGRRQPRSSRRRFSTAAASSVDPVSMRPCSCSSPRCPAITDTPRFAPAARCAHTGKSQRQCSPPPAARSVADHLVDHRINRTKGIQEWLTYSYRTSPASICATEADRTMCVAEHALT
jgi:hypothetical protein